MVVSTSIEGENERYSAALVLLHGLWAGPEIWKPVAIGLAHRGWRCVLVDARSGSDSARDFRAWCDGVAEQVEQLEQGAVVVGHDAGGLVALALAQRGVGRATIAVAPLLDGPRALLPPLGRFRARLGLGAIEPPTESHSWRRVSSPEGSARLASALQLELPKRLRSLQGAATSPGAPAHPALLVGQKDDAVVPPSLVEVTARGLEADYRLLPGGHWPMLERNIDAWMSQLHRWIIQRLPDVVLLAGDEDLRDE